MRASLGLLCVVSACTCDPRATGRVYACLGDGDCAVGWACIDGVCAESSAFGGGSNTAGGDSAGGTAGGSTAGGTAGGATAGGTGGGSAGGTPSALPQNVIPPSLDGSVRIDGGVTADDGTWVASSGGAITTTRRWLRCGSDGGACVPLLATASFTGTDLQTDATRGASFSGDGLLTDSSVGTWSAATNIFINGGFETSTVGWGMWAASGTVMNFPVLARDTTEHKFGTASMRVTTNGVEQSQMAVGHVTGVSPSTPFVASVWVKGPPGATLCLGVDEIDSTDTYVGSFPGPLSRLATGAWQRLSLSATTRASTSLVHITVGTCAVAPQMISFYVDGVQFERGTAPTPYIETNGPAATRADSMLSGPTSLMPLVQGWAVFRVRPEWTAATSNLPYPTLLLAQQATTNKLHVYYYVGGGEWSLERNSASQSFVRVASAPIAGQAVTVVGAWTASQLRLSVNGAPFVSVSSSEIPTGLPSTFDLGIGNEELLWAALGDGTLDDAAAAALHAFGDSDPAFGQLPPSATLLWTAETLAYGTAVGAALGYTPSAADTGFTLRLVVTATNSNGSSTATSAPFGPVTP